MDMILTRFTVHDKPILKHFTERDKRDRATLRKVARWLRQNNIFEARCCDASWARMGCSHMFKVHIDMTLSNDAQTLGTLILSPNLWPVGRTLCRLSAEEQVGVQADAERQMRDAWEREFGPVPR